MKSGKNFKFMIMEILIEEQEGTYIRYKKKITRHGNVNVILH